MVYDYTPENTPEQITRLLRHPRVRAPDPAAVVVNNGTPLHAIEDVPQLYIVAGRCRLRGDGRVTVPAAPLADSPRFQEPLVHESMRTQTSVRQDLLDEGSRL